MIYLFIIAGMIFFIYAIVFFAKLVSELLKRYLESHRRIPKLRRRDREFIDAIIPHLKKYFDDAFPGNFDALTFQWIENILVLENVFQQTSDFQALKILIDEKTGVLKSVNDRRAELIYKTALGEVIIDKLTVLFTSKIGLRDVEPDNVNADGLIEAFNEAFQGDPKFVLLLFSLVQAARSPGKITIHMQIIPEWNQFTLEINPKLTMIFNQFREKLLKMDQEITFSKRKNQLENVLFSDNNPAE